MDTTYMRERNYRMVENMRQQNMREQRRLKHREESIHGIEAAHKHELNAMRKEQAIVRKELEQIRKSSYTTRGYLPTGHGAGIKMADDSTLDEDALRKKKGSHPLSPRRHGNKQRSTRHSDPGPGPQIYYEKGKRPEVAAIHEKGRKDEMTVAKEKEERHTRPKSPRFGEKHLTSVQEGTPDKIDANGTSVTPSLQGKDSTPIKKSPRSSGLESKHIHEAKSSVSKRLVTGTSHGIDSNGGPRIPKVGLTPLDTSSINYGPSVANTKDTAIVNHGTPAGHTNDTTNVNHGGSVAKPKDTTNVSNGASAAKTKDTANVNSGASVAKTKDTTSVNHGASVVRTKDEKDTRGAKKPAATRITKPSKNKNDDFLENPVFDPELYSSDGTLRTVHTMPNFKECLDEAKKARYIRHPDKQLHEIELSVSDIFAKDQKGAYRK